MPDRRLSARAQLSLSLSLILSASPDPGLARVAMRERAVNAYVRVSSRTNAWVVPCGASDKNRLDIRRLVFSLFLSLSLSLFSFCFFFLFFVLFFFFFL